MVSQRIPNILRSVLLVIAAFSFAGCSSGPDIRSDYDPAADFGAYKTYNFAENAGPDYAGYQSFFTTYVIEAVTLEMEQRGYVKSNNPDLIVNFNANLTDKTKVSTSSSPSYGGSYYGYRGGHYGAWGGYGYSTQTHVSQYTEGTFNIDLVDNKRNQLVWEAVGVGRVDDKKMENLEQTVREAIPVYFSRYPFIAGDPIPSTGD